MHVFLIKIPNIIVKITTDFVLVTYILHSQILLVVMSFFSTKFIYKKQLNMHGRIKLLYQSNRNIKDRGDVIHIKTHIVDIQWILECDMNFFIFIFQEK